MKTLPPNAVNEDSTRVNTILTTTEPLQTDKATWAVVVVHGVGDTAPGATLGALIPPVVKNTAGGLEEVETPQNRLLVEQPAELPPKVPVVPSEPATETLQPASERFPMHLRRFRVVRPRPGEPHQAAFAEVFWADLAAASETRSDLVKRLFRLIFDLRHIPNAAAAYPDLRFAGVLRCMLYAASWLLIGPIAGMTLCMVYMLVLRYAAVMLVELSGYEKSVIPPSVNDLGMGLLGVSAVCASLLWTKYLNTERDETWSLLKAWFAFAGCISAFVSIGRVLVTPSWPWGIPFIKTMARHLIVGLSADPEKLLRSTLSTHLAVFFAIIYTTFVLLACVMTLAFFLWLLARGAAFCRHKRLAGPALDAALGATLLQVELFVVITAALGSLVLRQFYPDQQDSEAPLFTMMVTAYTLKFIFAMVIFVSAAVVWWLRQRTIKRSRHQTASVQAPELPRLLVHPCLMYLLIALTLFALIAFAYAAGTGDRRFHQSLQHSSRFVVPITGTVIIIVSIFFRKELGSWLHIMADITNHFYHPRPPWPWPWKRTEQSNPEVFTRQQRGEARFRRVLEEVLQLGHVTHLTIVAHSQGTITAIDVLWLEWAARLLAGKEVYLITMGSPFTHLYQYYFPQRYQPLFPDGNQCTTAWGPSLQQTIRVWTNVYRVDDFIGTRIDGDSAGQFPVNRCLDAGGHTSYWQQSDAVQLMLPYLPGV